MDIPALQRAPSPGEAAAGAGTPAGDPYFHDLLQALPAAIYTTDAAGRITFFNDAAAQIAGRTPELGEMWCVSWRLYWPDGTPLPHDECPMAIALKQDRPVRGMEILVERPDGTRIPCLPYPTPLHDATGALIGAVNMLVDISERQRAEQSLRQVNALLEQRVTQRTQQVSEAFSRLRNKERDFELLVGAVTDYAIYMLDPEGYITNWNAGGERIKGYAAADVIGRHFSMFYTERDRAAGVPWQALATAAREGRFDAEGWRVRKDGTRFWASVIIDPIYDKGELVGFAKITRDVTARKRSEEALVESERMARAIIDTAPDAFVQIDETGTILEWNPQAERMFGWPRQEAAGRKLAALIMPAPAQGQYQDALAQFLRTGEAPLLGRRVQLPAIRRDAQEITIEISTTALERNAGYLFNVFIRDITDKLATEARLHQAQKMEVVGQLTGGVAHDFNNLLTIVMGNLELLDRMLQKPADERTPARMRRAIGAAIAGSRRGAALTQQLLAFSRQQALEPKPLDPNALVAEMCTLLRRTLGESIAVETALAPDAWSALADPNQLENALLNLAVNARDAMPEGGRLTIRTENAVMTEAEAAREGIAAGEYVLIAVSDTGTGMKKSVVDRAFEPFFTTKSLGRGTGLGLSQVYGFVRQSNGHVKIDSAPGRGTTVRIYLPRFTGDAPDTAARRPADAEADPERGAGTVLVVEDDEAVRAYSTEALRQLGYTVLEAHDAPAALEVLQRRLDIDLLFTDIGLPGPMNGRELSDAARARWPTLKVLFTTGYARDEVLWSGRLSPGISVIGKPFSYAELASRMRAVLDAKA